MSIIIDFSRKQVGKPYVFAASGPSAFDCSGLTTRADGVFDSIWKEVT